MNFPLLLSESTVQALGWMLLHLVWQGFAVAAVLAGIRVVIKDPRLRYALACAALLVMVSLAASTLLTQEDLERSQWSAPTETDSRGIPLLADVPPSRQTVLPESPPRLIGNVAAMPDRWASLINKLQNLMPEIVVCWLAGVLLLSLRLFGG